MRGLATSLAAMVLAAALIGQAKKSQPVGLVMGAGAMVARGKAPAAAVKAGEVLFAGDALSAGEREAPFLFCPQKYSAALSAHGEAMLTESSVEVKTGEVVNRKSVGACYLPEVQKLSVASQQHYGVMMTRGSGLAAPAGTLAERRSKLPAEQRLELSAALEAAQGDDAVALVSRGAALEKAGLFYDAGEAYSKAAILWPEAAWLKKKLVDMDDAQLKQQSR